MNRFQLTIALGSGTKAPYWEGLIAKQCKRFKVNETELVRIALRTLERVSKDDAITVDKQPE